MAISPKGGMDSATIDCYVDQVAGFDVAGYKTHAAQLADKTYPLILLEKASVLVPDIALIRHRLSRLEGLPATLPSEVDLISSIGNFLIENGHFSGAIWLCESLENYVLETLLPQKDGDILNDLSSVMAETNADFDDAVYESAEVIDCDDNLRIEVTGQFNGSQDPDRIFYGDQIDMKVTVELYRVAGQTGFSEPDISASGKINDDWWDPDFKYSHGGVEARDS
jgi:hypothetical protein